MYHHALHDRYYVARDKLLMSHIQDNIDKVDTKTMILYNRALVTIGLSAFREGLVQKVCYNMLCMIRCDVLYVRYSKSLYSKT